jgi:SSS family transporter
VTVQLTVFALYFIVLFVIGALSLRLTSTEADYWIAGGKLGWLVGGATLAATHCSAGTFVGTVGVMHSVGWSFGWLVLFIPVSYWFLAAVLAPRFTRQRELTLPAFIETRYYSKVARAVAAVIILAATVVYIQAQIVAGGLIANVVLGIPTQWGMVGFTVILIAYTMVGGMIAVVYTDLVQLVVMTLGAVFAVPLALRSLGGLGATLELAEVVNPLAFSWEAMPPTLLFTIALAFALGTVATPEKLVRLYAMKDMRTIRRGVLLAIVFATGLNLLVFVVALSSSVLFPVLPTGDLAMPLIARAALPPFLGSILLAAITAAMMSTVDSLLIVAGSALAYDLYGSMLGKNASPRTRELVDRFGVAVVGAVPLVLLLSGVGEGELVQFIVLLFTALMGASFFAPVVLGVFWRRATREGAIAAMLGGVGMTFLWKAIGPENIDPVLPGFLCSTLLLVVVSLATPRPPAEALEPYFDTPAEGSVDAATDRRS